MRPAFAFMNTNVKILNWTRTNVNVRNRRTRAFISRFISLKFTTKIPKKLSKIENVQVKICNWCHCKFMSDIGKILAEAPFLPKMHFFRIFFLNFGFANRDAWEVNLNVKILKWTRTRTNTNKTLGGERKRATQKGRTRTSVN